MAVFGAPWSRGGALVGMRMPWGLSRMLPPAWLLAGILLAWTNSDGGMKPLLLVRVPSLLGIKIGVGISMPSVGPDGLLPPIEAGGMAPSTETVIA